MNETLFGKLRSKQQAGRAMAGLAGIIALVTVPVIVHSLSAAPASPSTPASLATTSSPGTGGLGTAHPGILLADNDAGGTASPGTAPSSGSPSTATSNPAPAADNQSATPSTAASSAAPTASPNVVANPAAPAPDASAPPPVAQGFSFETLPIKFTLTFSSNYDDNIYIRNSNRVGDFYWKIIPGMEYKSRQVDPDLDDVDPSPENYFHLVYKPELDQFLHQTANNFLDHHAAGNYAYTDEKLKLGLDGGFNTSHYPNIDFGGRLDAAYYNGRAYWQYALSRRLTLGGDVSMLLSRYKQGFNTDEWTTTGYLDYALFPKTTIGLGTTVGYLSSDGGQPYQDYAQFHGRVSYQILDKINLVGKAGVEYREYNEGRNTSTNPNVALAVNYQPFDATTVILQGERRTVTSISQSLVNYNDSNVSLTVRQGLFQKLFFSLKTSFEHDDYFSVLNNNSTGLTFDYAIVRPSLEWDWNQYVKISAYYEWENNHSSVPTAGFYDNSVGIGLGFSY